jgi:hypothetical protein
MQKFINLFVGQSDGVTISDMEHWEQQTAISWKCKSAVSFIVRQNRTDVHNFLIIPPLGQSGATTKRL